MNVSKRGFAGFSLLFVLLLAIPAQGAVLWFSGCEGGSSGSVNEFLNLSSMSCNTVAPGSGPGPVTGQYLLSVGTSTYSASALNGTGLGTIYARFQFQWDTLNGINPIYLVYSVGGTHSLRLSIDNVSHKLFFSHDNETPITTGTTALSVNTWYKIDVKAVANSLSGGLEVKINDLLEFTSLSTDTTNLPTADGIVFGQGFGGVTIAEAWDDMMVCSGGYCPSGGTIARQGTSGSPTYTAWTKNSCTGNLIENCWSDTPFNAASNATDSTLNDAQTMLVHSFSTTQSGHGTQTILSGATINACKTSMVAKAASGGTLSIRRRLNGVDTDTAKIVTTSDAYYDDGIWTDTVQNLNTSEIGVKQGANTVSQQVEDMWEMCDYLAGTGMIRHRVTQ